MNLFKTDPFTCCVEGINSQPRSNLITCCDGAVQVSFLAASIIGSRFSFPKQSDNGVSNTV